MEHAEEAQAGCVVLIREVLTELRERLADNPSDESARCWSDESLLRVIHGQMRGIATDLADSDNDFYACELELGGADAVQVHTDLWAYDLPPFVHHIVPDGVRKYSGEAESRTAPEFRNPTPRPVSTGWLLDEDGTLRYQSTTADDLIVCVAKMPARPLWATLSEGMTNPSSIVLPVASSITGGVHVERDAYAGMRLVCASQPSSYDQAVVGHIARVVQSRPASVGGTARVELVLSGPLPAVVESGGVIESILQVPEFSIEYLIHSATIVAMARRNRPMTDGMQMVSRVETARFLSARHRDESGAKHFAPDLDAMDRRRRDPDYYTEA